MTADEIKVPYSPGPNAFDITPAGDGGVLKEIIKQGEGEYTPNSGCKVYVHYTGTLTDGTVFDSSRDRGEPFEFNLGKGQVIKGWDIGVATMKRKEVAMLTCRSDYAYGKSSGSPKIPPDSTLHFEVEMIDWQKEDLSPKKDGGILRNILQPGEGHATPNDGSMVDVHLICEYNGKVVEERDVTFNLGEGIESGIPQGVEKALEKFKLKEKSQLEIKSKYAWGKEGRPDLQIPPNSDLIYTITLNNFEKLKETWALDSDGKLEQGKFFKEKGTNYFKLNKLKLALKMYKKAIEYLEFDSGFVEEGEKERKALLISNHLNCALCLIKLQEFTEAKEQCNKALELEPTSEKGLFRRGQANLFLGEPEIAKVDFETVLKQDPNNKAAAQHVMVCNQKMKEQKAKEKQIYANMFEKFAQKDREKEEEERKKQPDVMKTLGEWGQDEREREPTEFEKENPNILMLDGTGDFKNM
ncbi:FK506-binding protein 59-like isoform X2 [Homalodisca vitripennis]|nr:FK506-binding protein 59-like isoform X2 [Homalodisca vitripennis]